MAPSTSTQDSPVSLNDKLLEAASDTGDDAVMEVRRLLRAGADVWYQEEGEGKSALMVAASKGSYDIVDELLLRGSPWCALDRFGRCAGEYALQLQSEEGQRIVDRLVNAGVQAELLFRALENSRETIGNKRENDKKPRLYLTSEVRYEGGDLLDAENRGVMMQWEEPLMEAHAAVLCDIYDDDDNENENENGVDVLNVGFGLGLIDTAFQEHGVRTHTIIEAHPDVHKKMIDDGWANKSGVHIVFGRWQDHIDNIGDFDAVFFDSFDDVTDMDEFHVHLPKLVRPGGLYSYFNGVCANNLFFQGVASQLIVTLLNERGFEGSYTTMQVKCTNDKGWNNTKFRYFNSDVYYLPLFKRIIS